MNDRNLCYCHLAHPLLSDIMFASTVSRIGKRCAQVYATDFGWARAFPTASRSYKSGKEVPKTVMSGEASDISQFCKLEWFEWVMFEMKLPCSQMMF